MRGAAFFSSHRLLALVLVGFAMNALLLTTMRDPWFGEDESNHFGQIEARIRHSDWYLFDKNTKSIEMLLSRHLFEHAEYRMHAIDQIYDGVFLSYRSWSSGHMNATAYQPPLYYWIAGLFLRLFAGLDVITQLYVARLLSVFFGLCTLVISFFLLRFIGVAVFESSLIVGIVSFWPAFLLLHSTVSVWPFMLFVYLCFFFFLLRLSESLKWVDFWPVLLTGALGLYTQQSFLAVGVIFALCMLRFVLGRSLALSTYLMMCGLMAVVYLIVLPYYASLHGDVRYVNEPAEGLSEQIGILDYIVFGLPRISEEIVYRSWDQHNSFIALQSLRSVKLGISFILFLCLSFAVGRKLDSKFVSRLILFGWIAGVSLLCFLLAHILFDYYHMRSTGTEYFKSRYLFPVAVPCLLWLLAGVALNNEKPRVWVLALLIVLFALLCHSAFFHLGMRLDI